MATRGKNEGMPELSNVELKRLLDQSLTRFENWRIEMERNPNPRMVHTLRNVISIVDSVSSMVGERLSCSYKGLVERMALLVQDVATLNMTIVSSLRSDDVLDQDELKLVSDRLFKLINSAVALAKSVQESFGQPGLIGPGADSRDLVTLTRQVSRKKKR